jgi:hypothetical protein
MQRLAVAGYMAFIVTEYFGTIRHSLRKLGTRRIAMQTLILSEAALELLTLHSAGRYLSMRRVSPESLPRRTPHETRLAYRELVDAGLMIPVSTFAGGPEAIFRLTPAGDKKYIELQRPRSAWWLAMVRRIRRAGSLIGSLVSAARRTASS